MVEPVLRTMALILGAQVAALAALERATPRTGRGIWLAPRTNAPKRATELWFLRYAAVWIGAFALIIGLGLYERFTAWTYLGVCGGLALPLALQPFLYPGLTREADRPLAQRYALKANVWLADSPTPRPSPRRRPSRASPHHTFADRGRAYTVGSAFYGLYFVVSFPAFLLVDEAPAGAVGAQTHSLARAAVEALAAAMAVLQLLDFVRLALGIPLVIRSAPG